MWRFKCILTIFPVLGKFTHKAKDIPFIEKQTCNSLKMLPPGTYTSYGKFSDPEYFHWLSSCWTILRNLCQKHNGPGQHCVNKLLSRLSQHQN